MKTLLGQTYDADGDYFRQIWTLQSFQRFIEEFATDKQFDLISLRMVAEHVTDPTITVCALNRDRDNLLLVEPATLHRPSPSKRPVSGVIRRRSRGPRTGKPRASVWRCG